MNFKATLFLSLLIISCLGFLKKHKLQNSIQSKEGNPLAQLEDEIFERSALYRTNKLTRLVGLNNLAEKEAQQIDENSDFGKHTNFYKWAAQTPYEHYTEISVKMTIATFATADIPVYAEEILNAIMQQKDWYMSHEESYGGIKVYSASEPGLYIIVFNMLKPLDYYRSCKDSRFLQDFSEFIDIYNKDEDETYSNVACEQKQDEGGWTMLLDANMEKYYSAALDVKDLGFDYTQMYWKKKNDFSFDYAKPGVNFWDCNGYSFPLNMLQIDNSYYYISRDEPARGPEGDDVRGSGFDDLVNNNSVKYFNLADVKIIERASKCYFSLANHKEYCAAQFIMDLPGKITKFTDAESVSQKNINDNYYKYSFELYVR